MGEHGAHLLAQLCGGCGRCGVLHLDRNVLTYAREHQFEAPFTLKPSTTPFPSVRDPSRVLALRSRSGHGGRELLAKP